MTHVSPWITLKIRIEEVVRQTNAVGGDDDDKKQRPNLVASNHAEADAQKNEEVGKGEANIPRGEDARPEANEVHEQKWHYYAKEK